MTLWTSNLLGVVSTAVTPHLNPVATVHLRFTGYNYSFNTVTVANKSHGVLDWTHEAFCPLDYSPFNGISGSST